MVTNIQQLVNHLGISVAYLGIFKGTFYLKLNIEKTIIFWHFVVFQGKASSLFACSLSVHKVCVVSSLFSYVHSQEKREAISLMSNTGI